LMAMPGFGEAWNGMHACTRCGGGSYWNGCAEVSSWRYTTAQGMRMGMGMGMGMVMVMRNECSSDAIHALHATIMALWMDAMGSILLLRPYCLALFAI
jgi:hypothetical protein